MRSNLQGMGIGPRKVGGTFLNLGSIFCIGVEGLHLLMGGLTVGGSEKETRSAIDLVSAPTTSA